MPANQVRDSIPILLSAYSKNEGWVSLKNKETNEWYFSDNIPNLARYNILKSTKNSTIDANDIKYIGNDYLNKILGVTCRGEKYISGKPYELYITKLCKLNEGNPTNALICVSIIIIFIFISLYKISKGTSRINRSISAKLWLTLLVVAVIPVIAVSFVFGLFRNEFHSIKSSVCKMDMLRSSDVFEKKDKFYTPLKLKDLIKAINSKEVSEDSRSEALNNIHNLILLWANERKPWEINTTEPVNFRINNIFVFDKNGWNICLDEKDSRIINSDNKINKKLNYILKDFSEYIFCRNNNNFDENNEIKQKNRINVDVLGDEVFLKMVNGINMPIYFDYGNNRMGLMFSLLSNEENPETLIIWVIDFDCINYLSNLSKNINTKYSIYFIEKNKYGEIYKRNNNYWRIPLGQYAFWIATTNLPISDYCKLDNKFSYYVEGRSSLDNQNSLTIVTFPMEDLAKELTLFSVVFYVLLAISLIIIIATTRNIANDIINPIKSLIYGIREVNKENFAYRINSDRKDELGAVCSSFDKMVKGLEEKRTMSKMMSNTAKRLILRDGTSSNMSESVMLYIGIPNISSYNGSMKDREIFEKLRKQTVTIFKIIIEEGGEIDKIIGERILAVFPIKKEKDEMLVAKTACMAAKRLIEIENTDKLPFSIAIGINFGNVINGFLGIGNKRDFTVIGDAVNITARLENLAEKLEKDRCLISESFFNLINNAFKTNNYGEVELKGKSKPMKVYQLL